MGKFDIEKAIIAVIDAPAEASASPHHRLEHFRAVLRRELRAAVLAGREEALAVVSQQHANGWTGERGDGWRTAVTHCEAKIRELPDP